MAPRCRSAERVQNDVVRTGLDVAAHPLDACVDGPRHAEAVDDRLSVEVIHLVDVMGGGFPCAARVVVEVDEHERADRVAVGGTATLGEQAPELAAETPELLLAREVDGEALPAAQERESGAPA